MSLGRDQRSAAVFTDPHVPHHVLDILFAELHVHDEIEVMRIRTELSPAS